MGMVWGRQMNCPRSSSPCNSLAMRNWNQYLMLLQLSIRSRLRCWRRRPRSGWFRSRSSRWPTEAFRKCSPSRSHYKISNREFEVIPLGHPFQSRRRPVRAPKRPDLVGVQSTRRELQRASCSYTMKKRTREFGLSCDLVKTLARKHDADVIMSACLPGLPGIFLIQITIRPTPESRHSSGRIPTIIQ